MMDVRAARVCVRGRRRPPHGLDYGSREEAISEIPGGEADSVAAPRAYRREIEIERIDPDCFLAFQTFREFSLMNFFFGDDNFKLEGINI